MAALLSHSLVRLELLANRKNCDMKVCTQSSVRGSMMKQRRPGSGRAFTLIELLVVIAVIAILGQFAPHTDDAGGCPNVQSGPPVYSLSAVTLS